MADPTTDTGRIERDLDQTRARLGSHLSELQDRLSPGQVLDDLMSYFRGSEGAAFGRSLMDNVRTNPMPAAITTVGLAWLMSSNPRGSTGSTAQNTVGRLPTYGHDDHTATLSRLDTAQSSVTRTAGEADHAYTDRLNTARGQAIGLARHAEETSESFGDRVSSAVSAIQQAVTGKAQDLASQAGGALESARSAIGSFGSSAGGAVQDAAAYAGNAFSSAGKSSGQVGSSLVSAITESPVLLGALGLAAGALLGALLPHSEQEEAMLGGIAGQARDTVRTLANEGMERGTRVVQAVTQSAQGSVQGSGLTSGKTPGQLVDAALSGELAGNVKQVASDVLRAGEDAVRKEGLG